jgi:Arc/MetJ family transcription regulator
VVHGAARPTGVYIGFSKIYTDEVSKRLVDIDDTFLEAARAQLGTSTIKATVNEALRLAGENHEGEVTRALNVLARVKPEDRSEAWR